MLSVKGLHKDIMEPRAKPEKQPVIKGLHQIDTDLKEPVKKSTSVEHKPYKRYPQPYTVSNSKAAYSEYNELRL